jgi:hypothetical protein
MGSHTMFAPARYLADFARFAATKSSQEQHDRQALAELERRPLALAPGVSLSWLGVSGYRCDYKGHTLLSTRTSLECHSPACSPAALAARRTARDRSYG